MGERDQSRRKKANMSARATTSRRNSDRRRNQEKTREKQMMQAGRSYSRSAGRPQEPSSMPPPISRSVFDVQSAPVQRSGKPVRSDGMQQIILPMGTISTTAVMEREQRSGGRRDKRKISRREQRRRRARRRLLLLVLLAFIVVLGVFLSVNVLFKVEGYRIEDMERNDPPNTGIYTEDAIIAALNVPIGDNLFGFGLASKAQAMEKGLPYMEHIELKRSLPSTVVVRIEPAVPKYVVEGDFGWAELSKNLKVLSVRQEPISGLMQLKLPVNVPTAGEQLSIMEEEDASNRREAFDTLISLLSKEGLLNGVTSVDMENMQEITFLYQDRILVKLGTANSLDYKLRLCGVIIRNDDGNCLDEHDRGTLDASYLKKDGTIEPVFRSANDVDITASIVGPEEVAEDGEAGEGMSD